MKSIFVVGFMGAGKTTVGQALAQRLGLPFADLDDAIEAAEGAKIADIFATKGEEEFRRLESETLRRLVDSTGPAVIALGGGAFTVPANRELLRGRGTTIWLDCPFEVVERRVAQATHRPLARDPERFAALYQSRRDHYSKADHRILVFSDDPDLVVGAILAALH